jgi:1-acyl-sn-glycerol-3-phosphate acyltransferase
VIATFVRSLVFQLAFILWFVFVGMMATPFLLLGPRASRLVIRSWSAGVVVLSRWVVGIDFQVSGREHLPPAPFIVASKHQSTWETCALAVLFDDGVYVLKRELMWIPFFGWYAGRGGNIAIDRSTGRKAVQRMLNQARRMVGGGTNIIIFPEGTRTPVGDAPELKPGIVGLYRALALPVVPVSLDSGRYWPRRGFLRYPGTIKLRILPSLPPGLDKTTFLTRLHQDINQPG